MVSPQLYDKLLELPLFQGLSKENLATIVSQTKLGVIKLRSGKEIIKAGDTCDTLYFLMSGKIEVETKADDNSYVFLEEVVAPQTIQIECVFGLTPRYTRTCRTRGACRFISLAKSELIRLLDTNLIFRINFLNAISTYAQRMSRLPWKHHPTTVQGRLIAFLIAHCLYPAGRKVVLIKMTKLAEILNENRLSVSKELNDLEKRNLLRLNRGRIEVTTLENFIRQGL